MLFHIVLLFLPFALSFIKKKWSYAAAKKLNIFKFEIYASAPPLLGARMHVDFRHIALNFTSSNLELKEKLHGYVQQSNGFST